MVFGLLVLISKPKNCVSRLAALTLSAWRQRRSLRQVSTRLLSNISKPLMGPAPGHVAASPLACCAPQFRPPVRRDFFAPAGVGSNSTRRLFVRGLHVLDPTEDGGVLCP